MSAPTAAAGRKVNRIDTKTRFGPNDQVDDRAVLIAPNRPALTDPFLLLSEDWFSSPGFEWHPHRGLETVTTVLDGVLEHGDNAGNVGALAAGDVQWMTAGRGIIHRELAYRNEHAHTLQLWVNLPRSKRMTDTRYQDLLAASRPQIEQPGSRFDIISGTVGGVSGPALNNWPITGMIVTVEPGRQADVVLPGEDRAFAYVLSGVTKIAGRTVGAGKIAWSDPVKGTATSTLPLQAADGDTPAVVMIYSGRPIGESIVMGGPFVMNTNQEIRDAFDDFHSGKFGQIPRQARLKYR
ncbi:pirin family protein [Catellatospora citrea]|uniref:pirin family protein n=1 Tax=Catellatospora citrea TaxID=53366 RepID=UPI0034108A79